MLYVVFCYIMCYCISLKTQNLALSLDLASICTSELWGWRQYQITVVGLLYFICLTWPCLVRLEDFDAGAASEKWDRIRFICCQPFRKDTQFGLSLLKIVSDDDRVTILIN